MLGILSSVFVCIVFINTRAGNLIMAIVFSAHLPTATAQDKARADAFHEVKRQKTEYLGSFMVWLQGFFVVKSD